MPLELNFTLKDAEGKKLSKSFLTYEEVTFKTEDPVICGYVKELLEEFKGVVEDIKLKATMVLR